MQTFVELGQAVLGEQIVECLAEQHLNGGVVGDPEPPGITANHRIKSNGARGRGRERETRGRRVGNLGSDAHRR